MAFPNVPSVKEQSIAGAICTGTHGSGLSSGSLSSFVTRLQLVDGHGEVHELSTVDEPQLFKAAQVSLGALGIITEVTLQVRHAHCVDIG